MKGIVITPAMQVTMCDLQYPIGKTLRNIVGGYIEHVSPPFLEKPYCMIINEGGLLEGLPLNPMGSCLYGTRLHGQPIVGTIVLVKDGYVNGERDIDGLDDAEAEYLYEEIKQAIGLLKS